MLQPGQLFAKRYRVETRLAQGGMGVIYAAEHMATEERVALKVLWPHVLGSKAAVENFQLEARIAARLGGEHIVRILDAGVDEACGLPYLAMELLQGQALDALVGSRGPLAPAEVLWVMRQVARALDRAHGYVDRKGRPAPIVHRDLKPENLFFVAPEGATPCVKVLDFGIAKVLSQTQKFSQELRGTPLFMASEQIEGKAVTPQLDVWALGLIAFYLLTGRYYWVTASQPEAGVSPLFHEILHKPLDAPSDRLYAQGLSAPWPPGFDAWFLRCVHRDPGERLFPAGAAVEALAEALGVTEAGMQGTPSMLVPLRQGAQAPVGGPRAVPAPAEAPGATRAIVAAASGLTSSVGDDNSVGSVVQPLSAPRSFAMVAGGRRRKAVATLAASAAGGVLLAALVSYRYLGAKKDVALAHSASLPGALSLPSGPIDSAGARPLLLAAPAPSGDGEPSPRGAEPSPTSAGPAASASASAAGAASQEAGAAVKHEAPQGAKRERQRQPPSRSRAPNANPDPYEFRGE